MKRLLFLALFTLVVYPAIKAQNPNFYKEDLTFVLTDSSLAVSGYYYFHNATIKPISLNMLYPFPVNNEQYGGIRDVYAYFNGDTLNDKLINFNDQAAFVKLEIEPKQNTMLFIGYTQEISGDKAEYILTSTQTWGKPFVEADYALIIPESIRVDSLSYAPDFSETNSGNTIYYYHKEDFMPDREFEIYFK